MRNNHIFNLLAIKIFLFQLKIKCFISGQHIHFQNIIQRRGFGDSLFGHELVEDEETGVPSLYKASGDNAPYLGVGYYRTKRINNKDVFEAKWIFKTKFQLPSESDNTKGQSITWGTPQITGRIVASNFNGRYEEQKAFETAKEAVDWLNTRANIVGVGG